MDVADGQAAVVEDFVGKRRLGYGRTSNPPEDTLPTGVRPIKKNLFGGQPEVVGESSSRAQGVLAITPV